MWPKIWRNFMRTLALPKEVEHWSMYDVARQAGEDRGQGCPTVGRYVTFQLAEVAVPRDLFRKILRIDALQTKTQLRQ